MSKTMKLQVGEQLLTNILQMNEKHNNGRHIIGMSYAMAVMISVNIIKMTMIVMMLMMR